MKKYPLRVLSLVCLSGMELLAAQPHDLENGVEIELVEAEPFQEMNQETLTERDYVVEEDMDAQARSPFTTAPLPTQTAEEDCPPGWPRPYRITASHIEGKGIGYNQGYTSINGFFALDKYAKWVPFLDIRNHIFNDGKYAANAGLGIRWLASSLARSFGANVYYDYRNTQRLHYNQIGAGLEALGTRWDFRINGYLPLGRKTSKYFDTKFYAFQGNNIIIQRKKDCGMAGFDAEAGYHVRIAKNWPLYLAAGPYYLHDTLGTSAWGGDARVAIGFKDFVNLQGSYSYDSTFRSIWQGQVSITLPFGRQHKLRKRANSRSYRSCNEAYLVRQTLLQDVYRKEIVVVDRSKNRKVAINPTTGDPYVVFFVDNTSSSAGTYESPFATLAAAESASSPNDIIYVFPGDNTSNGMNAGIVLQNGQTLLGASIDFPLQTTVGSITIPPFASTMPLIANTTGDVVTISNGNTIAGMYIQNNVGNGISQPNGSISVNNLIVTQNIIQGTSATMSGIYVNNLGGTVEVTKNTILQPSAAFTFGMLVANTNVNNSNLLFSDNQVATNTPYAYAYTNCFGNTTTITNNAIYCEHAGVSISETSTVSGAANTALITNNTINGDIPLLVTLGGMSNNNMVYSDNTYAPNQGIYYFNSGTGTGTFICNNNESSDVSGGITLTSSGGGTTIGKISGNTFRGLNPGTDNTLNLEASGTGSMLSCTIVGNQLQSYEGQAIEIATTNSATADVVIADNSITAPNYGVMMLPQNSSTLFAQILDNTFQMCSTAAITATGTGTSQQVLQISENTFTANPMAVSVTANGIGSLTCLRLTENTATPIPAAYNLTQTAGTFNLEPLVGNVGQVSESGIITNVPAGTCQ